MPQTHFIPIGDIKVNRAKRQRREITGVEELAHSINECGLINPIVLDKNNYIIAGERRFEAIKHLGHEKALCRYITDLSPSLRHMIELEENISRKDLPWQDHVAAVQKYHQLKVKEAPNWDQIDTALALNLSAGKISRDLILAEQLKDEDIADTKQYNAALNKTKKKKEREQAATLDNIDLGLGLEMPKDRKATILNTSFIDWARDYQGPKFNFIHCDFPYGIEHGASGTMLEKSHMEEYHDEEQVYARLLTAFGEYKDNFASEHCHIMFWCATRRVKFVISELYNCGFRVNFVPLIWYKSDGKGISPDQRYLPRHIYETAMIAHRGSRQLAKSGVADVMPHRVVNQLHKSEKPVRMLEHFFQMFVDKDTNMLDPTCGCGNSVKVAESMGAARSVGIELNPEIYEVAKRNLEL